MKMKSWNKELDSMNVNYSIYIKINKRHESSKNKKGYGERIGGFFGSILRWGIEIASECVGFAEGLVSSVAEAKIIDSFYEGTQIGKDVGKAICEASSKIAGLSVGALAGFWAADINKNFKDGVDQGIEKGKKAGNYVAKKAGEIVSYGVGFIQGAKNGINDVDYEKKFNEGTKDGK